MARDVIDPILLKDKVAVAWLKSERGILFSAEFGAQAIADKRKRTMTLDHQDMGLADVFVGRTLGFEGDFEEGTGELVAIVQAEQEVMLIAKRTGSFKKRRGRRGGRGRGKKAND